MAQRTQQNNATQLFIAGAVGGVAVRNNSARCSKIVLPGSSGCAALRYVKDTVSAQCRFWLLLDPAHTFAEKNSSILSAFRAVYREGGVLRFYRGLLPEITGTAADGPGMLA